eukprot:5542047-Pyramimonas_sp.AAC.1
MATPGRTRGCPPSKHRLVCWLELPSWARTKGNRPRVLPSLFAVMPERCLHCAVLTLPLRIERTSGQAACSLGAAGAVQ